ncbi:hypothetical protein [Companilactobacillus tucceti]|nr:hypothetical protein [Companilactobacillus tucceti]
MTNQVVNKLGLTALAAVGVVILMLLFMLQIRYAVLTAAFVAIILAVYAQNIFGKHHTFILHD